jgi:tellurite methyltransferase
MRSTADSPETGFKRKADAAGHHSIILTSEELMQEENVHNLPPMTAQDYSEANDWSGYFGAVLGKGARGTLMAALDRFAEEGITEGFAVDVAAGEGRDTLELLKRGWRVVATDSHPEAFSYLWPRVPEASRSRLNTLEVTFSEMRIPNCDLVNASYALPFCEPCHFQGLWRGIVAAIRPGGRFAGQFFGMRDSWASLPGRSHHSKDEVLRLLEGFEIEMMEEEESEDTPDVRNPKHWQLFHVVAKKR